jgi:hypothetical protein
MERMREVGVVDDFPDLRFADARIERPRALVRHAVDAHHDVRARELDRELERALDGAGRGERPDLSELLGHGRRRHRRQVDGFDLEHVLGRARVEAAVAAIGGHPAHDGRRAGLRSRREDDVGSLAGRHEHLVELLGARREAVVAAEPDEAMVAQAQVEVPRARGVDDSPALAHARTHLEARHDLAVHEQRGAFAPEQIAELAAAVRRQHRAVLVEAHVRQHEHELVAWQSRGLAGIVDDDRAVEAAAHLCGRVDVRVVPVGAGVAQREFVAELAAARNRRLRGARRAVHLVRDTEAVPMDRRRLG